MELLCNTFFITAVLMFLSLLEKIKLDLKPKTVGAVDKRPPRNQTGIF